jgi:sec-independent protein translocase protein TatB
MKVSLAFMVTPPSIQAANLGMADSLILMVMALVVFGPRRLPQIGRQIGKLMYEFRKASNDFKFQMEEELRVAEEADRRKKEEERQRTLALNAPSQESVSAPPPASINAVESPYAGESQYPEISSPAAAQTEETTPRILPPSTGEPIPSARPSRPAEPPADASVPDATGQSGTSAPEGTAEPATQNDQATAPTEAVSHNG